MKRLESFGIRIKPTLFLQNRVKEEKKPCLTRSLDGTVFLSSVADVSPHPHSSLPSSPEEPLSSSAERRWDRSEKPPFPFTTTYLETFMSPFGGLNNRRVWFQVRKWQTSGKGSQEAPIFEVCNSNNNNNNPNECVIVPLCWSVFGAEW